MCYRSQRDKNHNTIISYGYIIKYVYKSKHKHINGVRKNEEHNNCERNNRERNYGGSQSKHDQKQIQMYEQVAQVMADI